MKYYLKQAKSLFNHLNNFRPLDIDKIASFFFTDFQFMSNKYLKQVFLQKEQPENMLFLLSVTNCSFSYEKATCTNKLLEGNFLLQMGNLREHDPVKDMSQVQMTRASENF